MKQILFSLIFGIIILIIIVGSNLINLFSKYYLTPCPASGPEKQSDFPIYLEEIDIDEYYDQLFSFENDFSISTLDSVEYKGKKYLILSFDKRAGETSKKLLIIAATHGNEFASALVVPRLLEEISSDQEKYQDWDIKIISPANPVGLAFQSRYNEDGCDINRDFQSLNTIGAQVQDEVINDYSPDVVISLHESPRDGFFIIGENNLSRDFLLNIIEDLKNEKIELGRKNTMGIPLKTQGLSQKTKFELKMQDLLNISTFGKYASEKEIDVITTESPWNSQDIDERIRPHLVVIDSVVENH